MNLEARLKFSAGNLKSEVTKAKGDLKELEAALKNAAKSIGTSQAANASKNVQAVRAEITRLLKEIDRLKAAGTKNLSETTQFRRADILGGSQRVSQMLGKGTGFEAERKAAAKAEADAAREAAKAQRELAAASKEADQNLERLFYQFRNGKGDVVDFSKHAITLRYALYDVAAVSRNIGGSLLQLSGAFIEAGIRQESAFTQVEKTLEGVSQNGVQNLKNGLIELSQTIPVAFQDVSQIAMLGSQLNVAQDELIGFTDTVAKFSALSQMGAEETAMSFGKVANVLGLVGEDGKISGDAMRYLGSAIVAVGYNAAATEQQILRTAQQIGAISTSAGIAATDTIALSSAFASLAIAPEEARGVTVQLFNELNKAANSYVESVKTGSDTLRVFATVAGMSQEKFSKAWKDKSSQSYFRTIGEGANSVKVSMNGATYAFEEFVSGLGKGYDVQKILTQIGLDGVRTSKGLTALAKGFAGIEDQIAIARQNGLEGTFLDVAYSKVADDLNSKILKIKNSLEAFMAAGTDQSPIKEMIGGILDLVNALLIGFQKITANPAGATLVGIALTITTLTGAIGALGAMVLVAGGSMLAMRTALASAAGTGLNLDNVFVKLIATMLGFNREQLVLIGKAQAAKAELQGLAVAGEEAAVGITAAATASKALKWAMAATGIGAIAVLIGSAISGFMEMADAEKKTGAAAGDIKGGLNEAQKSLVDASKASASLKSELQDLFTVINSGADGARKLDSALYSSGQAAKSVGKDFVTNSQALRDYEESVTSAISAAVNAYGDPENQGKLKAFLTQYLAFLQSTGTATAAVVTQINNELAQLGNVQATNITFDFAPFLEGLKDVNTTAAKTLTLLEAVQKSLAKFMNAASVYSGLRDLGGAITGLGASFSSLNAKGGDALNALNSSIEQIVANANDNPQKAANQLKALRQAMWQLGVTSKAAYTVIDTAISATGKKGKAAAKDIKKYYNQLSAGLAEATKKDTRTIDDWANEVSQVISDAFEIRFRGVTAQDAITSGWRDLSSAITDAKNSVQEYQQTLDELNADKGVLEYQYKIAVKYGDALRANKISASLKKINADIVKTTEDKTKAEEKAKVTTNGNTDAAIANRDALRNMAKSYQDYLITLARTTTDQNELNTKADQARAQFMSQGKALGFADSELQTYADTINVDFKTAIKNLPTDITLKLGPTDPIVTAITNFVAKANAELAKISVVDLSGNVITTSNDTGGQTSLDTGGGQSGSSTGSSAPSTGAKASTVYSGSGSGSGGSGSGGTTATPKKPTTAAGVGYKWALVGGSWLRTRINPPATRAGYKTVWNASTESWTQIKIGTISNPLIAPEASVAMDTPGNAGQYKQTSKFVKFGTYAVFPKGEYMAGMNESTSGVTFFYGQTPSPYKIAGNSVLVARDFAGKLPPLSRYATGGFVSGPGTGTSDSIPARLSNGEFVMRAAAVRAHGTDFMNALNQTTAARPSYSFSGAAAGSSSSMVYLSPEDRALLRAAIDRPVNLYTESTKIAQAANEGNVLLARKGTK